MRFNQKGAIFTLNGGSPKSVNKFTYIGNSISSTENDITIGLAKAWTAIDRLSISQKSDLSDKRKPNFFQAAVASVLLYGRCTIWTQTKHIEKKLDENYTRKLRSKMNKSWKQHSTKQQLYGHLPPISESTIMRRTRHEGYAWRSKDKLISDVLLSPPSHGRASVGRTTRPYLQHLCTDTGCSLEDLQEAMDIRDE